MRVTFILAMCLLMGLVAGVQGQLSLHEQEMISLAAGNYTHIMAGDSITRMWYVQNRPSWDKYCGRFGVFNAGVGGNRIWDLSVRIVGNTPGGSMLDVFKGQSGGLCPEVFAYMIGINNLNLTGNGAQLPQVPTLVDGIIGIQETVHEACPDTRVRVIGLIPNVYSNRRLCLHEINKALLLHYGLGHRDSLSAYVHIGDQLEIDTGERDPAQYTDGTHLVVDVGYESIGPVVRALW